ncbi:hypothetical protein WN944_018771 [Citrus x changshan-huyou]|uniref:Uncharacterized protein n=1 Tax=Citrus x changshan-huyou TaxID=2935761 RepID=A0AAP0LWX8_9ROSI
MEGCKEKTYGKVSFTFTILFTLSWRWHSALCIAFVCTAKYACTSGSLSNCVDSQVFGWVSATFVERQLGHDEVFKERFFPSPILGDFVYLALVDRAVGVVPFSGELVMTLFGNVGCQTAWRRLREFGWLWFETIDLPLKSCLLNGCHLLVYEDEKLSLSMEVGTMAFCSFPTDSAKMFWFDFHLVQNIMRASLLEMVF